MAGFNVITKHSNQNKHEMTRFSATCSINAAKSTVFNVSLIAFKEINKTIITWFMFHNYAHLNIPFHKDNKGIIMYKLLFT